MRSTARARPVFALTAPFWMIGLLYNNTGKSVFAVVLFHAVSNVRWQSFPIHGSYLDPRIFGLIMLGMAAVASVVGGPRTLAKSSIM